MTTTKWKKKDLVRAEKAVRQTNFTLAKMNKNINEVS